MFSLYQFTGIGNATLLKQLNIQVLNDLPGVGGNLQVRTQAFGCVYLLIPLGTGPRRPPRNIQFQNNSPLILLTVYFAGSLGAQSRGGPVI